jgi:hypothetical protein
MNCASSAEVAYDNLSRYHRIICATHNWVAAKNWVENNLGEDSVVGYKCVDANA